MKGFHIVSVPYIIPAGGDEDQDLVGCLPTEPPGSLQPVKPLHQDIQKKNVKMSCFLKERISVIKLPDGTGEVPLLQNLPDLIGKRAALEHFIIAYGDGQHKIHLPFLQKRFFINMSAEMGQKFPDLM